MMRIDSSWSGVAQGPEHHRPQAEGADLDAGTAEGAVLHAAESTQGPGGPPRVAALRPPKRAQASAAAHKSDRLAAAPEAAQRRLGQLDGVLVT